MEIPSRIDTTRLRSLLATPRVAVARDPRAADEASLLGRIITTQGEIAAAGLDPEAVVKVVVARAQELTRSSGAVVELFDGDDLFYWIAGGSAASQVGLRLKADTSLSGLCVRTGEVLHCVDSETDPRVDREACRRVGLRSMIVVPLRHDGSTVGVLKVLSPEPGAYGPSDVRTMTLMATLVGATLTHALQHAAMVDTLQGQPASHARAAANRAEMRSRLEHAMSSGAIERVFQPIRHLQSRRICGFETLARFRCDPPQPPDRWFAQANQVGIGKQVELHVIRLALTTLERIPAPMYLSVNVSPSVVGAELAELVRGYPGDRIVLEITEHASVEDYARVEAQLESLRQRGIRLAIDDAGAGFASLRHIVRFQPDIIKVDASLTHAIDRNPNLQHLAAALLTFASGMDAEIVAEGIETADEMRTLEQIGVPFGQGYHLGRPGPLPDLLDPWMSADRHQDVR